MNTLAVVAIVGAIAIAAGFIGAIVNMAIMAKRIQSGKLSNGFARHFYFMLPIAIGMLLVAGSGIAFGVQFLQAFK